MEEDNINLMPENQRSKEKEIVSKQKKDWEYDLVVPGQENKFDKGKKSGSKVSVWTKLFKSKKHKKVKEDKVTQDKKPVENVKTFTPVDKVESVLSPHNAKTPKQKKNKHKKNKPAKIQQKPAENKEVKFVAPVVPQDKVETNFSSKDPVKVEETEPNFDLPKIEDHKFETHKQAKKKKKKKKKNKHKQEEKKPVMPPATGPSKDDDGLNLADWHQPTSNIRARFLEEGVDLIPTAVKIKSWNQIKNLLIISFVLSVVIVALFYVGLMWQERKIINEKQLAVQGISDLEEEILSFQAKNEEISALAEDIKNIHAILNQHVYWSNFFGLLEKYTAQEVYYQGLTAGNNGALTLHAIGPNFDAVARQLKALQSEEANELAISVSVTAAALAEIGADEPSVSFDINFILNPQLFYYENNQ